MAMKFHAGMSLLPGDTSPTAAWMGGRRMDPYNPLFHGRMENIIYSCRTFQVCPCVLLAGCSLSSSMWTCLVQRCWLLIAALPREQGYLRSPGVLMFFSCISGVTFCKSHIRVLLRGRRRCKFQKCHLWGRSVTTVPEDTTGSTCGEDLWVCPCSCVQGWE